MLKCYVFVCLFSIFYSCNHAQINSNSVTDPGKTQIQDQLQIDSLREPYNYYYLSDLPLRKAAEFILNDSVPPSDNKITFTCLDSMSSESIKTRDFFFPVFLKIVDYRHASLDEVKGLFILDYIEKHPKDFATRTGNISDTQFQTIADYAGYELYFKENENLPGTEVRTGKDIAPKTRSWTEEIMKRCGDCDKQQKATIKRFNKLVIESVVANSDSDN